MIVPFSQKPGRHERHFKRRLRLIFPRPIQKWQPDDLLEVQRLDHQELLDFIRSLKSLVLKASQLKPHEETAVILDIKNELENHYRLACALADEQSDNKAAIRHLLDTIHRVMIQNAAGTPIEQELNTEVMARQIYFEQLEYPLVADLMHPNSLIEPDELVPILLTDPEEEVKQAMQLFEVEQQKALYQQAAQWLKSNGLMTEYKTRFNQLAEWCHAI